MNRRDFLQFSFSLLAGSTALGAALTAGCGSSPAPIVQNPGPASPPNLLLIIMDEFRYAPKYGPNEGEDTGLKEIFGFANNLSTDNPYTKFFPGLTSLRKNSVVLRNH